MMNVFLACQYQDHCQVSLASIATCNRSKLVSFEFLYPTSRFVIHHYFPTPDTNQTKKYKVHHPLEEGGVPLPLAPSL